ncbi:MAG: PAS domain-containing protein [Acidimicrobiia bacterium]|nr:MAG: PAS domain-containing protein [Acidimicrobiia bacterium]
MDTSLIVVIMVALVAIGLAFELGRRRGVPRAGPAAGRRLEEYDFYPFSVDDRGHVRFEPALFTDAVTHLLEHRDVRAAGELIVIGQQNLVRDTFGTAELDAYKRLYSLYDGDGIVIDNEAFLENYRRLVSQLGRSFRHTGIEILLHNLVNPSKSLVAIENGEVTGRSIGGGATNLVLDLKTRRQRGEDKVNYELNIGARQFKCTTVPIFRPEYGLVGAVCINVDTRFIREAVAADRERLDAFIDNLLRTDFQLEENILSKDEYHLAQRGKRHFMDDAIRAGATTRGEERRLAAILFSDIVDYTERMAADEAATLEIVRANEAIHSKMAGANGGRVLKLLGDGVLCAFDTATGAAECARDIMRAVEDDGRFALRIGIHLGEVIERDGDVHGDGVNVASRIESTVGPGQIGLSQVVHENIRNKGGLTTMSIGSQELKGVDGAVNLYLLEV